MKIPVFLKGKTFKIIIKLGSITVFLIVFHLAVGRPIVKKADQARQRSYDLSKKLEEVQQLIRKYPNPMKEIEAIKKRREEFQTRANASNELPRIIQQLTQKSSELDLEIVSIRQIKEPPFPEPPLPEGVDKAYLEVVLRAPYSSTGKYLKAISNLPSLCTVESISLRRTQEKDRVLQSGLKKDDPENIIATLIIGTYTVWRIM